MQLAARPALTAGIALAGAAVIAASPMPQRLPDLHVAQHLTTVNVSEIQLTDTAGSMIDLPAGVENELASLAGRASAAAVPAAYVSNAVNPIQTWISLGQTTQADLQGLLADFQKLPLPVLRQVGANMVQYASTYVGDYQTAANASVNYFLGSGANDLIPTLANGWTSFLETGNLSAFMTTVWYALYFTPIEQIGLPMEGILGIPGRMVTNFANFANYWLDGYGLTGLSVVGAPTAVFKSIAPSLAAINTAWSAGDPVGVLTNVANIPGAMATGFEQYWLGTPATTGGTSGYVTAFLTSVFPRLAKAIVTPNAQNIATGGSLATGLQNFANQLMTGWPSSSAITTGLNYVGGQLTMALQNLPSVLSNLPSAVGQWVGQVGTLLINLLKLL
ncbi:hypothetical protein [Mycobacterium malmoense]|uniref:hypothetical protein n=1 Tax=Mycobacterium malmoense TaxID=1780 RepID=UPI00114D4BF4|nr:hypothetical protein [Mycobacterium malmoense]